MKHKAIIFTLSCLILGLCSCKSTPVPKEIDINNRPKGYFLDYWIKEKIDIATIDKSLIYEIRFSGVISILDSRYEFIIEQGEKKLPKKFVFYICKYSSTKEIMVESVVITDPSITVYGLSMNSSENFVNKTLIDMGFTYQEYSGRSPSYIKDRFDFTINDTVMHFYFYSGDN